MAAPRDGMIQTVTGPIHPEQLGRTLMHEHLLIGYPGWESNSLLPGKPESERFAVCVDRIEEIRALGFSSLVDPCPNDLGRDVEFIAKVAQKTGFQIICATGLYKQAEGGHPYWHFRENFGSIVEPINELMVREIEDGVGATGVHPGIIKVATGPDSMTEYERSVFAAAARASLQTGTPITTHTDAGTVGDAQQEFLTEAGVAAHRIVIGHSCGTSDNAYHTKIARGGSYLGFDRFGIEMLRPDAERVAALVALLRQGAGDRIVVSHDSVWCWRGEVFPPGVEAAVTETWNPSHFSLRIVPQLKDAGIADEQIEALLVDNPKRFFAGGPLPALPAHRA